MPISSFFDSLRSKLFKRKKKFRDQQGFDYTISIANGCHRMAEKYSQWHGQVLGASIQQYKKSDTLFILGSGPSINLITTAHWEHIRKHDSIGFNWWMAHDFVPSFYLVQFAKSKWLFDLIQKRSPAYKDVPLILRGDMFANGQLPLGDDPDYDFLKNHNLYYMKEYAIASRCAISIPKLFEHVQALGMLTHGTIGTFVPKWRSTLGLLMSWGYQMGYKRIVLCGMDMQNSDHFWNQTELSQAGLKYQLPGMSPGKKKKKKRNIGISAFTDKALSENTVPKYVIEFADWMNREAKVETYIGSSQTLLHPDIPVYDFT